MKGYFFKQAKDLDDDLFAEEEEFVPTVGIEAQTNEEINSKILNALSRIDDAEIDQVFSIIRVHLNISEEINESMKSSFDKIQFIASNLKNLNRADLISVAKTLLS